MWKKNENKKESSLDRISDKAAWSIGNQIKRLQTRFGSSLNRKTEHLDKRGKVIFLIVFCFLFGGASTYILVDSIISVKKSSANYAIKPITVPRHYDKTGEPYKERKAVVSGEEIARIRAFRHFMDSLLTSKEGTILYDSIVRIRPGLLDSLEEAERLYNIDSITSN